LVFGIFDGVSFPLDSLRACSVIKLAQSFDQKKFFLIRGTNRVDRRQKLLQTSWSLELLTWKEQLSVWIHSMLVRYFRQ
jgi:hypothetical protein